VEAIRKDLNEAQQEAVLNHKGPALVIAGAGSGKTRVLTYRVAYLLSLGISPSRILALTFTNKAASEMKERIATLVTPDLARRLWMGTFHSLFARILRREAEVIGFPSNYTIYDTIDSRSLVKTIIREFNLDEKIYKPAEVFGRISRAKNNLVTPEVYLNSGEMQMRDKVTGRPRLGEIYDRYVKRCKHFGAMDFDDLLLQTNLLFRDHPEVLDRYRDAFDYILVDEYQDTNYSQYLIINKLSQLHRNICVVGDDAQSIYSFRGARIENILNFKNDYPDYRLFKLERNYRSTQTIVKAANSVIRNNRKQISKEIYSNKEPGEQIRVVKVADEREEGFIVASHISDLRFREQLEYNDFAVLYRTNAQSRIFEESLRKMNIPYKVFGSLSFYQRKEIKDLLAYFRITVNPRDDESLKRVINYPLRGIGKTTMERLVTYAGKLDTSLWDILLHLDQVNVGFNRGTLGKLKGFVDLVRGFQKRLHQMEAFDMAYTIIQETGILDDLKSDQTPENVSRYENVEELLNGIRDFTENPENEREMSLADFLQQVTLMTDADLEKEEDRNKVSIMTIHSAKGLEFKHLVVAGVEEELFPSHMSSENPNELEEERRLFYVALTRAGKSALITYAASRYKWGIQYACSPSRFIREINPEYLELPSGFSPLLQPGESPEEWSAREQGRSVPGNYRKITGHRYRSAAGSDPSGSGPSGSGPSGSGPSGSGQVMAGGRKLVSMNQVPKDFNPSNPDKIRVGTRVEHPRFGIGEVMEIEGEVSNVKATVRFPVGKKQLLLKFAKLRVIE